jgi:hypothetical protein
MTRSFNVFRRHALVRSFAAMAVPALLMAAGCGTSKPVMEGTVTLDGVPIEKGVIVLTPPDGRGQTAGCGITAGSYRMQAAPGTMQVSIMAERKDGTMPDPMSPESGAIVDRYVNYVPERYNKKSELTVTIKPGLNKHDFQLEGGHREGAER